MQKKTQSIQSRFTHVLHFTQTLNKYFECNIPATTCLSFEEPCSAHGDKSCYCGHSGCKSSPWWRQQTHHHQTGLHFYPLLTAVAQGLQSKNKILFEYIIYYSLRQGCTRWLPMHWAGDPEESFSHKKKSLYALNKIKITILDFINYRIFK